MLTIQAKTVYIDPAIDSKPNCKQRLDRVLPYVQCDDVRELNDDILQEVLGINRRRHGKDDFGDDAIVVFTTFDESRSWWYYCWRDEAGYHGGICQPGLELNIVAGCVFRCAYCGFGRYIVFSLDVERFVDGLDDIFARHPSQRLYKYSNMTDLPPFEPELNALPPVIERFAREPDRYVMLFTKSDNVDSLAELEHRGHTIISWSVTCETASRLVDKRTASMQERIAAMGRMQQAGYHVRARLSPIVPVVNWREEYTRLFEELFEHAQPDVITLELLGWMAVDDLLTMFDRSLLDGEFLAEAEAAREEMADFTWGPFTQHTHEEIYAFCIDTVRRLSPGTAISVCHGTTATWRSLGARMQMSPDNYICNCGPLSAPGGGVYQKWNG
jgi:spore photoproduct lyase